MKQIDRNGNDDPEMMKITGKPIGNTKGISLK